MPRPKNLLAALEKAAEQKKEAAAAKAAGKEERRLRLEKERQEAEAARKKAEEATALVEKRDMERRIELWNGLEKIAAEGKKHPGGYKGYLRDQRRMDPSGGMTLAEHIASGWEKERQILFELYISYKMSPERQAYYRDMFKLFG